MLRPGEERREEEGKWCRLLQKNLLLSLFQLFVLFLLRHISMLVHRYDLHLNSIIYILYDFLHLPFSLLSSGQPSSAPGIKLTAERLDVMMGCLKRSCRCVLLEQVHPTTVSKEVRTKLSLTIPNYSSDRILSVKFNSSRSEIRKVF